MYGTIWRARPKSGREQEAVQLMEEWGRERGPKVQGVVGSLLYKLDNGGLMGVAVFDSKENYRKNAEDPAQDAWYRRWRETLESDPEWNDGEIIGGSGSISA